MFTYFIISDTALLFHPIFCDILKYQILVIKFIITQRI